MFLALIGVLYAIILAIILIKSPDIIPEQRRGNAYRAIGYTTLVVPLLIFEVGIFATQVKSAMGAYAGAVPRRVHPATVLLRPPIGHRPKMKILLTLNSISNQILEFSSHSSFVSSRFVEGRFYTSIIIRPIVHISVNSYQSPNVSMSSFVQRFREQTSVCCV